MEQSLVQQGLDLIAKFNEYRLSINCKELTITPRVETEDNVKFRLIYLNCIISRVLAILRVPVLTDNRDETQRRSMFSRTFMTEIIDWTRRAAALLNMVPQIPLDEALLLYKKYHCAAFMYYVATTSLKDKAKARASIVEPLTNKGAELCTQRYWHKKYTTGIKSPVFAFEEQLQSILAIPAGSGVSNAMLEAYNVVKPENNKEYPRRVKIAAMKPSGALDITMHSSAVDAVTAAISKRAMESFKRCYISENVIQSNISLKITSGLPYHKYLESPSEAEFITRVVNDTREVMVSSFIDSTLLPGSYTYREQYISAMSIVIEAVSNMERNLKSEIASVHRVDVRCSFPIATEDRYILENMFRKIIGNAIARLNLNKAQQGLERIVCK